MKMFRWLLSHFFLILLIVVVIYGYMFWGNLAGENTPAGKALAYLSNEFVEVEEFITAIKDKQAQLSVEQTAQAPTEQTPTEQEPAAHEAAAHEPAAAEVSEIAETAQPAIASLSGRSAQTMAAGSDIIQPSISQAENEALEQDSEPSIADFKPQSETAAQAGAPASSNLQSQGSVSEPVAAVSEPADKFVSAEVKEQLENVDNQGNIISKSVQGNAVREIWITARKSFYQRNFALSEKSYRDVIDNTTDNYDAYGELGNVYFNQGKKQLAAQAYYDAATILLRKGQVRRAQSLMGLLKLLDKNKANDLQKQINSITS